MAYRIRSRRVLVDGKLSPANLRIEGGTIHSLSPFSEDSELDFSDALILPGLVDIHGDAFERQLMPRPGVTFPHDLALIDTDRQLIANGITTAFHGLTWSWEPGLRGANMARAFVDALEQTRPRLLADHRLHLRQETYNIDAEAEIIGWLSKGRIDLLAFNDHMEGIAQTLGPKRSGRSKMIERTGLSAEGFEELVLATATRASEVPSHVARLAEAARQHGVPMLSHDDRDIADRLNYRALGVAISEFPMTLAAAQEAIDQGETTVFGAPNVVRGGSHTGCPSASDMVQAGLCSALASDYYYPALLQAPFRLAANGILPLEQAWALVSAAPAQMTGLNDRGKLEPGARADLVIVDDSAPSHTSSPRSIRVGSPN
jgi:alpha-D-ribose 1-methylphosphonate 5-triphosphate diphosphatase